MKHVKFRLNKIFKNLDIASPWRTKNCHNSFNFWDRCSNFGFSLLFRRFTHHVLKLKLYDQFKKTSFFSTPPPPPQRGLGEKFELKFSLKFCLLIFMKSQEHRVNWIPPADIFTIYLLLLHYYRNWANGLSYISNYIAIEQ